MKNFDDIYDLDAKRDPHMAEYAKVRDSMRADPHSAIREMETLAYRGSIMSILFIADAMLTGSWYEQDLPGAERWFEVAAKSGSVRGIAGSAATHLLMGRHADAIKELEEAISKRYPPAINSLAKLYFLGQGVPEDKAKALSLWREGAALGHLHSKRHLVHRSLRGHFGIFWFLRSIPMYITLAIDAISVVLNNRYTDRLR